MTESVADCIRKEARFSGIERFAGRASGKCQADASAQNTGRPEEPAAAYTGPGEAIAARSGREALRLAVRLAAERIRGGSREAGASGRPAEGGYLSGQRVFCPDFAPDTAAAVISGGGGEPVFIDASPEDWGMDPEALAAAFEKYPGVRLAVCSHVYGFPARIDEIKKICEEHGALLIEDASEASGAEYKKRPCGSFGDYAVFSLERNQMIAGSAGGMLLVSGRDGAEHAGRRMEEWEGVSAPGETVSRDKRRAAENGRRMSDVTAGIIRGQWEHPGEYMEAKRRIYERYARRLEDLDISMNPYDRQNARPNYRVSCMTVGENGLSRMRRVRQGGVWTYSYDDVHGRTCPAEIRDALEAFGAAGSLLRKPLHGRPPYRDCELVTADGCFRGDSAAGMTEEPDEGTYLFERGLCLPSDAGMTEEEQERVIEIIYACFNGREWKRAVGDHGLF